MQALADRIRVAALGFWHVHAADYCATAVDHPATELAAVWDDDPERGRAGAAEFGVPFEGDLDRLLASDIDAVIVTTATSRHRAVMEAAADAGKHIFTEKLLAPTVDEAEAIVAATDGSGVKLAVSLPRLYTGYTRTIREALDAGTIGHVSYCRVRLSHAGAIGGQGGARSAPWLPDRFFDPDDAVGGALTDLGCHPAYLVQLLLGSSPETVSATYRSFTRRTVEDHGVVTVGYADQSIGVIEAGFVSGDPFSIEVMGTDGWLTYRHLDGEVRGGGPALGGSAQSLPMRPEAPRPFDQWVGHIVDDTRADDNIARAVELTRLVVAANTAAATGATVPYAS